MLSLLERQWSLSQRLPGHDERQLVVHDTLLEALVYGGEELTALSDLRERWRVGT